MAHTVPGSDLDATVQALIAKQAIHDALMRYCAGIDRGDLGLILSAFHDDALDNHSGVEEKAVERFSRTVGEGATMWTSHNLGNVLIEVDGSIARSQSYLTAWHRFDIEGRGYDWIIAGRYLDRFERRAGEWRISYRTVVYDCERFEEVKPKPTGHPASTFFDHVIRGQRSRADHYYELFDPDRIA